MSGFKNPKCGIFPLSPSEIDDGQIAPQKLFTNTKLQLSDKKGDAGDVTVNSNSPLFSTEKRLSTGRGTSKGYDVDDLGLVENQPSS